MNSDKKLKKLVEKTGKEINNKHNDFYNKMVNTYYVEQNAQPKTNFWLRSKTLAAMACCLAVVCFASVGLGIGIRNSNRVVPGSDIQIVLPSNAQKVQSINTVALDINRLRDIGKATPLSFDGHGLAVGDVSIYEDSNDGNVNFYYVTQSGEDGCFYSVQVIVNKEYEQISQLDENATNVNINGVDINYSVVYVENMKMVYFFAESQNQLGEKLVVKYTTTAKNCEQTFLKFLKDLVK